MRNVLIALLLCLFLAGGAAAEQKQGRPVELFRSEWNGETAKQVWKESKPGNDFTVSAQDGSLVLTMTGHNGKSDVGGRQIWINRNFDAKKGSVYRVRFLASASVPGKLGIGGYESGGKWRTLGTPVTVAISTEPREVSWNCVCVLDKKGQFRLPSLTFGGFPAGSTITIGTITVEELSASLAETPRNPVQLFSCKWNDKTAKQVWKESKPGNTFTVSAQDGVLLLTMEAHNGKSDVGGRQIWTNRDFSAKKGTVYRIRFRARASVPGKLGIGGYQAGGKWLTLGKPTTVELTSEWREVEWVCTSSLDWTGQFRLPSLTFGGFPAGSTVSIGTITAEELMPFQPLSFVRSKQAPEWFSAFSPLGEIFCGIPFQPGIPTEVERRLELKWEKEPSVRDALYLLHTGDGLRDEAIGKISFCQGNRQVKSVMVRTGVELDNVRSPKLCENGFPGSRVSDGTDELGLYLSRIELPVEPFDRIVLERQTGPGEWYLVAASLSSLGVDEKQVREVKFVANAEWRPIDLSDLYIRPGSALDLSDLADRAPCGTYGRVIVNAQGRTAFEKRPEKPVRFFGHSCGPEGIPADKEKIEAFADALAAQGYNMIRFHGINGFLISRNRWDGKLYDDPETIPFIKENEDRFHYLLFCLKQRGIYVYLDLATFSSGWTTASIWGGGPTGFGVGLIAGNEAYRANYRAGVLRMLTAVNPYTKMRLADDPTIAVALFHNEQNLRWSMSDFMGRMMQPKWIAFLKKKYGSIEAVRKAWKETPVPEDATWESLPLLNMPATQKNTVFACDMAECIVDSELELTRWYEGVMKEAGYRGLTSQWDFIYRLSEIPPRASVPVVSMHAYHAHPSDYISRNSTVPQSSVITSGCSMLRVMAPVRFIDRPYMVSEYGQVFWNRYRHEQGLASSYAALQEWDLMMVHAAPVVHHGGRLVPFQVGPDPVIRASDVVTAFAYLRGDVSPARRTVVFPVNDEFIFQGNRPFSAFNGNLAFLFAVSRIGLRYDRDVRSKISADLEVPALGDASFNDFGMYGSVTDSYRGSDKLVEAVAGMRANGLIGPENRTDPDKGIYESDTGELTMNIRNGGILDVVTPRLEGTTIKGNVPKRLDALSVEAASCPASITVIARNADRTIESDDRLLAIINTDALNSGMTFTDNSRYRLVTIGTAPVLVQTGTFRIGIRNGAIRDPEVYALKLNGLRGDRIPARSIGGEIVFEVDTAKLPVAGPTPFFEIVSAAAAK